MEKDNTVSQTSLVFGLLLILFGGGMLLWTVGKVPFLPAIIAALSTCLGIIFLYFVYYLEFNEFYLFAGMFLIQGAVFGIVKHKLPEVYILSLWPVFLLMSGLTLMPYSLRKKRKRRTIFLVPAISFIILSIVFLPFSLNITTLSLGEFVRIWWPLFFLILGLVISVAHFIKSLKVKREESDSR
ncbi:MAG: hypothetical protein JEY99_10845 [Spirochaetales bacterium]|nr:hypothetical protein [Spirochaetales bacterium]